MKNILQVPDHLAVIIDGNRRWSRKRGLTPWIGHRKGAKNFENFLQWCCDLNVPQVSAYLLSTENLTRPKREVEELLKIYQDYLERLLSKKSDFLDKYQVRVKFAGDLERLPPKLVKLMGKVMEKTAKYQKKVLNLLIAYGSHFELTEVMKKIAKKAIETGSIEITERDVEANLLVPVPIDLVIRTGGHSRLSNFMLWQAAYAELYITKTLWPDFSKKELIKAIEWYNSTQRNFGK
jgi:undecaprenyl diphosphate synthase